MKRLKCGNENFYELRFTFTPTPVDNTKLENCNKNMNLN